MWVTSAVIAIRRYTATTTTNTQALKISIFRAVCRFTATLHGYPRFEAPVLPNCSPRWDWERALAASKLGTGAAQSQSLCGEGSRNKPSRNGCLLISREPQELILTAAGSCHSPVVGVESTGPPVILTAVRTTCVSSGKESNKLASSAESLASTRTLRTCGGRATLYRSWATGSIKPRRRWPRASVTRRSSRHTTLFMRRIRNPRPAVSLHGVDYRHVQFSSLPARLALGWGD